MFDIFAKLLSSIASFLFPLFASYKALKTSDPAQLTPWLMYWVVLACALLVESWTEWFLVWIPFYAYIRLLFLLYLVLPQTQGARVIYTTHLHPWLQDNEGAIEDLIASAHERLRAAGMAYIKRAIELLKTNVLGMPPSPPGESGGGAGGNGVVFDHVTGQPASYTQTLLARFSLPSARWSGSGSGTGGATDFYSFLASAVGAAAGAGSSTRATLGEGGGETLIPEGIKGHKARMSFIAAQRERLGYVLSALEREATELQSESERAPSMSLDGGIKSRSMSGQSLGSETGSSSGLSKSRSEADFEKLEAESGAEEENSGLRRRGVGEGASGAGGSGGGSWMPWGWGGGGGGAAAGTETPTGDGS